MKYIKLLITYLRHLQFLPKAIRLHKSPLFLTSYYLKQYKDVDDLFLLPEIHYIRHGMFEQRNPHLLFDTAYYIGQVPDFFRFKLDPVAHFLNVGASQGISPHPLFDLHFYARTSDDNRGTNPLEKYISSGDQGDGNPNPLFFSDKYLKQINELSSGITLLEHYLAHKNSEKLQTFTLEDLESANHQLGFACYIERFSTFQGVLFIAGWAFAPGKKLKEVGFLAEDGTIRYTPWQGLPSEDLVEQMGPSASHSRFDLKLLEDLPINHLEIVLVFRFTDGSAGYAFDLSQFGLAERPHTYFLQDTFIEMLKNDHSPAKVLEIGSRDRSGFISRNAFVPEWMDYTGTDILAGENVDIVCDAHEVASYFQEESFDYVFSLNVFEHILMPWKVVLEINKLLKVGGKVMIFTHQTMPLHDTPCDYWRFSDMAWQALFNADTGFAISYSGMGDPVQIVALKAHPGSYGLSLSPAYLHSMVIAEKTGCPQVEWKVKMKEQPGNYPTFEN